jgi:hypothetical protein
MRHARTEAQIGQAKNAKCADAHCAARPQSSPPDSKGAGLMKGASYGLLFFAPLHLSARQRFLAPLHVSTHQRFLACRAGLCVCNGGSMHWRKGSRGYRA